MATGPAVLYLFSCHVRHIEASYLKLASGLGSILANLRNFPDGERSCHQCENGTVSNPLFSEGLNVTVFMNHGLCLPG